MSAIAGSTQRKPRLKGLRRWVDRLGNAQTTCWLLLPGKIPQQFGAFGHDAAALRALFLYVAGASREPER